MVEFPPPIIGRKIRFALAGCGRVSKNHFEALKQHAARAELVGVCDIDRKSLDAAANITGAKPYSSVASLLAQSGAIPNE